MTSGRNFNESSSKVVGQFITSFQNDSNSVSFRSKQNTKKDDQPSAVVFYIMILSIISRKQVFSNQLSITSYRIEPQFGIERTSEHKVGQI